MKKLKKLEEGTIIPALLIITGAFIIVIYGVLFVLGIQYDFANRQESGKLALGIAEAGVNYYRWHLAHDPDDYEDGNPGNPGPYEHEYTDPQGTAIGKFSLNITPPSAGSSVVTIQSTGWTYELPNVKRTITVQYGQPSLTTYSFLQNASSWYGSGITVSGQVHSNNGIRMDGTNLSLVNSAQGTYVCGSETGCTSQYDCENSTPESAFCTWNSTESQCECEGVWGGGGDQGLWQYPVTPIDFDAISFDFTNMRDQAQTEGLYLGPSGSRGYHIVFQDTGNVEVYRVTNTGYYWGYDSPDGCERRYQRIFSEILLDTYNIADVPIIFAEDHLWVEGEVDGRSTVVAARFPIETNAMNIWIPDSITYTQFDDNHSLGLIAQNDIYYARNIPEDFVIHAALMAQQGKIIRHGYFWWCGGSSQAVKDSLTILGAVISYEKSYWNWGSSPDSGFQTRDVTYDSNLLYFPPPYFPTSGEYEFISWVEE